MSARTSGQGSQVNDTCALRGRFQPGQRLLSDVHHRCHIHIDNCTPEMRFNLSQPFAGNNTADVIDQNINASQKFRRIRHAACGIFLIG